MKSSKNKLIAFLLVYSVLLISCNSYLEIKPNAKLAEPASLQDLQALLDDFNRMTTTFPSAGEGSSDHYFLTDDIFDGLPNAEVQRMYLWETTNIFPLYPATNDWEFTYRAIYSCNYILRILEENKDWQNKGSAFDDVKGQALFMRAMRYFAAAEIWTPVYKEETADTDPGLPLRLNDDFTETSNRASVQETYNLILDDLSQAIELLPVAQPFKVRPNKAAALGLMARICLSIRKYEKALDFAQQSLGIYDRLVDYNALNVSSNFPMVMDNEEVLLSTTMSSLALLTQNRARVSPVLMDTYAEGDLRRQAFFLKNEDNTYTFKGSYFGSSSLFNGIATDEMFLISAETSCRLGDLNEARNYLNSLLKARYAEDLYSPVEEHNQENLLTVILKEREKELLMRGLRWSDLRRLQLEGREGNIQRLIHAETKVLESGGLILPIPEDVLQLSGMEQNVRF